MTIRADLFDQTRLAIVLSADDACLRTSRTRHFFTASAAREAVTAEAHPAPRAGLTTVGAEVDLAVATDVSFVFVHDRAAMTAVDAVPLRQVNVGAIGVVGF